MIEYIDVVPQDVRIARVVVTLANRCQRWALETDDKLIAYLQRNNAALWIIRDE